MRTLVVGVVVAVAAVAAGACGSDSGTSVGAGDLPTLPSTSTGGGGRSATMAAPAVASDMAGVPEIAPVEQIRYVLADDVSGLGGKAKAYRLSDTVDADDVRRLAERFGVDDEPVRGDDGVWRVGDMIEVWPQGGWAYGHGMAVSADVAVACPADGAECAPPAAPAQPAPPPDLPGREEALAIARKALGDRYEVSVDEAPNALGWFVTGRTSVDGVPVSGIGATALVGSKGKVEYASGNFIDVEEVGTYPLAGQAAVEERLAGYAGGIRTMEAMAPDGATASTVVRDVVLREARVVLGMVSGGCPEDPAYLVPMYEFGDEAVTVPAVVDDLIDESPGAGDDVRRCKDAPVAEPAVEPKQGSVEPARPTEAPVAPVATSDSGEADPDR